MHARPRTYRNGQHERRIGDWGIRNTLGSSTALWACCGSEIQRAHVSKLPRVQKERCICCFRSGLG